MTEFLERRSFVKQANCANSAAKGILMMLDGDNFTQISEKWGPVAGEMAIQAIEEAIVSNVRDDDVVSYLDGDRFVVFANGVTLSEGQRIADRIRLGVTHIAFEPSHGIRHPLTISVGAVVAAPKQDADRLIDLAEACLAQAKINGRNNVVMKTYFRSQHQVAA